MLSSSYSTAHVSYMMVCLIESINSAKVNWIGRSYNSEYLGGELLGKIAVVSPA